MTTLSPWLVAALGWLREGIPEELGWLGRNICFNVIKMVIYRVLVWKGLILDRGVEGVVV